MERLTWPACLLVSAYLPADICYLIPADIPRATSEHGPLAGSDCHNDEVPGKGACQEPRDQGQLRSVSSCCTPDEVSCPCTASDQSCSTCSATLSLLRGELSLQLLRGPFWVAVQLLLALCGRP